MQDIEKNNENDLVIDYDWGKMISHGGFYLHFSGD